MRFLTAGEILAVQDLKREDVPVPEWGEDAAVHVQELSLSDRVKFLTSAFDEIEVKPAPASNGAAAPAETLVKRMPRPGADALLLSLTVVDDKGEAIFDEHDVKTLMRKSHRAAGRVCAVALRLSGLEADQKAAEKNSVAVPSGDSSLGSP